MRWVLWIWLVVLLPGCVGKNLSPEQLDALARLADIQKVSGCTTSGITGASPMVSGEGRFALCFGTSEPITVDQSIQLMQGISITVQPKP